MMMEVAGQEVIQFDHSFGNEAREWLATVCAAMERTPAGKLFSLLKPAATVQLVNQAKKFIEEAFQWQDHHQASTGHAMDPGSRNIDDQAFYFSRCALYIYYRHYDYDSRIPDVSIVCLANCRVLQGLLASAADKHPRTGTSSTSDARVVSLASNQPLQLALLTCAVEVMCFCSTGLASFPCIASVLGQTPAALELWEAAQHFLRYLEAETAVPVAESVASYLSFICIRMAEDLAWREGSTLYTAICHGGGGSCKQGDYALLTAFLESLASLSRSRVFATAAGVVLHNKTLSKVADFSVDCAWLMSVILQEHLDLLFNQHLSSIVTCCVYSIARAHGVALSFKMVVDVIIATFPHHTIQDFRHAELRSGNGITQPDHGDTRQLYNQVFLPRMDTPLQQKFPGVRHRGQPTLASSSKQQGEAGRLPLKSLSAADMNTRLSRFHRMQA